MADLALSAMQTLFAALRSQQLQEFCDLLGYKSRLKDLEKSVSTVRNVLIGAEIRVGELSSEEEDYIDKLKDAVYDADDLFDEVLALAELTKSKQSGKLAQKVSLFFSSVNPLSIAHNVSNKIKVIRKNLEDIASDHNKFGLKFDSLSIRQRKPETYSYVNETEVFGREGETMTVVDRLLVSSEEVTFLSIVGVGGLGKTTLAQLVYNDERIVKEFSGSRFWVCVSDHEQGSFDVRVILSKILELVTGEKPSDSSSMETVQCRFQEALGGKKCLLVLDDVWNENRCKWLELRGFLMRLGRESRILATTRSTETATIIGNGNTSTYVLSGLSQQSSWRLFALMAFGNKQEHEIPNDFVEIGLKIVEKCSCVPLVLKVVGSLLFGQEKSKWDAFEYREVTQIRNSDNDIMSILKFSYLNLEPPLKSCFKYCAMFPKDFEFQKEMLIRLWEAQGYIIPFEDGQSIEDAGEDYFSILLKRCFFQDFRIDEFGKVLSCKIHDLMHDLAETVARNEIWRSDYTRGKVGEKVRHLAHYGNGGTKSFPFSRKIRSCIMDCSFEGMGVLVKRWKRLRVLKLHDPNVDALPETIGNLLHLRSLDVSHCSRLRALPSSVTKLPNLLSLDISHCYCLEELPKTLSKLVKLEHLNFQNCNVPHMPSRMDRLTCLTSLTKFVVNEGSNSSEHLHVGKLENLRGLTELKGSITILVNRYVDNAKKKEEGGYLRRLKHLDAIHLVFQNSCEMESDHEALMEKLEPTSNLKSLSIENYKGSKIPNWGSAPKDWAIILPCLVHVQLDYCHWMEKLPSLSRLRHLKTLSVRGLCNLEYMEDPTIGTAKADSKESIFFPSLISLKLDNLYNLKRWWSNQTCEPCFPRLATLFISHCPNFDSFLRCPRLESLHFRYCNQALRINLGDDNNVNLTQDDRLDYLRSTLTGSMNNIKVNNTREIVTTSEAGKVLRRGSSLRSLEVFFNTKLTTISRVLEHHNMLQSLQMDNTPVWRSIENAQSWGILSHTLPSLRLREIPKAVSLSKSTLHYLANLQDLIIRGARDLESLPEWLGNFSSLTYLTIIGCPKLNSLPEAMSKLTSLHRLTIWDCSKELYRRCQHNPQGDDWPKIRHIPHISICTARF